MERDDVIEYSLDAHHSEEEGKSIRKKIVKVTIILSLLTMVEVAMGIFASGWAGIKWEIIKYTFIVLTMIKAGYIVMIFMHLGDERKGLTWAILIPYFFFAAYLIFICLYEGNALMP